MTIVVVIRTREPHRQAEGLRAALGLTLRGGRVEVVLEGAPLTPLAQRAVDTLRAFGHVVGDDLASITRAHVVEVWT